jgi:tRNA(Ile)-lysidine synthase TilS/MesJ
MNENEYYQRIIIPLLAASKKEVVDYCLANGLLKNYVTCTTCKKYLKKHHIQDTETVLRGAEWRKLVASIRTTLA